MASRHERYSRARRLSGDFACASTSTNAQYAKVKRAAHDMAQALKDYSATVKSEDPQAAADALRYAKDVMSISHALEP